MKEFEIWTDGSCAQGGKSCGPGGVGIYMVFGSAELRISKGYFLTTNNRMELLSILIALESLQDKTEVKIYTDSQYSIDAISKNIWKWMRNGWKKADKSPVKNKDLILKIFKLLRYHKVTLIKVKGHSGDTGNEIVDKLAKEGTANPTLTDYGFKG